MLRRVPLVIALLVLGSLFAVACGGGDDDGEETEATATEAAGDEAEETEAPEAEQPAVTESPTEAPPASTPTEDEPAATSAGAELSESALVFPPERDESIPRDGRVLGDPEAPVQVVEYGDFQ